MNRTEMDELDLKVPAANGLKRGWTTGTCAAAGVKAALIYLEDGEVEEHVRVTLPDPQYFLTVPIARLEKGQDNSVLAEVIKNGGDDPDNTRGATIVSCVQRNNQGVMRFLAGPGVGTVTEPGIRVPVGEPAINPTPRRMIVQAVEEVLAGRLNPGYDLTIGCKNGEEIAKRTFNPRLGIVGGISILGSTGIVEPMSLAAYKASIEVYIRVALAGAKNVAFMPGNIGLSFARLNLGLPQKRIVQIANFVGFALDSTEATLLEEKSYLDGLWLLGHPGKLAKILDHSFDTHSKSSAMAMPAIARVAQEIGLDRALVVAIEKANTAEAIVEILSNESDGIRLWLAIEERLAGLMRLRVPHVKHLFVRLFSMDGSPLGGAK